MTQPPVFEDPAHPDWVFKVTCTIYCLKKSPQKWNLELDAALVSLGLQRSSYDPLLYLKLQGNCLAGAITAHVDYLEVVARQIVHDGVFGWGTLHQLLLRIVPSLQKLPYLSISKKWQLQTSQFCCGSCKGSPPQYNQIIGSLLWVSPCTRPNIAFAVNWLS